MASSKSVAVCIAVDTPGHSADKYYVSGLISFSSAMVRVTAVSPVSYYSRFSSSVGEFKRCGSSITSSWEAEVF